VAATTAGLIADVGRFPDKDRFASYEVTAPIGASTATK
jgi:hypothetical protein